MPKTKPQLAPRFPALLIGRICIVIPVAGVRRTALGEFILGAWVESPALASACPEFAWTQSLPRSALLGPGAEAFSLGMERELGSGFSASVNEALLEVYPEAELPHRTSLEPASRTRVLTSCAQHSAFALFCAAPEASAWLDMEVGKSPGGFPDDDVALGALGYVMGSVRARLEQDSGLFGWRFPLRAPLLYHRALGQNPPREMSMPFTRLDQTDMSHWTQALTDMDVLSASTVSALDLAEIDAASAQPKTKTKSKRLKIL